MIHAPRFKKHLFNWGDITMRKAAKYLGTIIGAILIICLFIFIFFPDPIINALLKDRIAKSFTEAYPAYSINLGKMHYSPWKNSIACDSVMLSANDSTFTCKIASLSLRGINWIKILFPPENASDIAPSLVIDAGHTALIFHKSREEIRLETVHLSLPDSEMTADSIKYLPLLSDEQFFAKSKFRQTRYRFEIPQLKIVGINFFKLIEGTGYETGKINIRDVSADILVNMDKPYNSNSPNPQMPNEILASIKETIKVDSLRIMNGRLKYSERFIIRGTPGVITFDKINASISGIANHAVQSDTAVIKAEGIFMNSGKMKLLLEIPLGSKDFSLRYSGSLSSMDVTRLNKFIEPGEHHRIKSGVLQSATYNVDINSGRARGTLRVAYKDLTIAILNKETGSEKGIFNRILSFFGKVFVIRGSNMPDEKGLMKIGRIEYARNPQDYFFQILWFSLRSGVADVVGFPKEPDL